MINFGSKVKEWIDQGMMSPFEILVFEIIYFIHWQGQRVDGSCDPSSSFCTLVDQIIRPLNNISSS